MSLLSRSLLQRRLVYYSVGYVGKGNRVMNYFVLKCSFKASCLYSCSGVLALAAWSWSHRAAVTLEPPVWYWVGPAVVCGTRTSAEDPFRPVDMSDGGADLINIRVASWSTSDVHIPVVGAFSGVPGSAWALWPICGYPDPHTTTTAFISKGALGYRLEGCGFKPQHQQTATVGLLYSFIALTQA